MTLVGRHIALVMTLVGGGVAIIAGLLIHSWAPPIGFFAYMALYSGWRSDEFFEKYLYWRYER